MKAESARLLKLVCIYSGLLLACVSLYMVLDCFYDGMVEAIIASMRGGEYHPAFLRRYPYELILWIIITASSASLLAVGFSSSELLAASST